VKELRKEMEEREITAQIVGPDRRMIALTLYDVVIELHVDYEQIFDVIGGHTYEFDISGSEEVWEWMVDNFEEHGLKTWATLTTADWFRNYKQ